MTNCESCGQLLPEGATGTDRCPSCGAPLPLSTNAASIEHPGDGQAARRGDIPGFEAYIPQPHLVSDRPYRLHSSQTRRQEESDTAGAWQQSDADSPISDEEDTNGEQSGSYGVAETTVHVFNTTLATPLIIEILLSLFTGIFGVGWLMAGEIPTGILLLVGSFLLYLPLVIVSVILAITSVGLSLLCTGPLAIGAVCLNAFLLQNRLKRKAAQSFTTQGSSPRSL